MLALSFAGMVTMAVTIQVLSPISHEIQKTLAIDYGALGFLMGVISMPGIFLSLPAGYLADRWGNRALLLTGFLCLIAGALIFMLHPPYIWLCIARMVSGAGCAFLSALLPGVFTPRYDGKSLGTAMGIFNTALPIGSIATLTLTGSIAAITGCFNVFALPALFALVMLILFFFNIPAKAPGDQEQRKALSIPTSPQLWILAGIVLFANMSTMGYVTIAPSYFAEQGFSRVTTGLMLSAVLWGSLFLSPLAGYLTGRHSMGRLLVGLGSLLQGAALIIVPFDKTPLFFDLLLLAAAAGVIMTPVYIFVPMITGKEKLNSGYGVMMMMMMIGCLLGPPLGGMAVDRLGGFTAGFAALGIFSVLGAALALLIRSPKEP
jgi:predicted MFS family arabinose efflux permease